MEGKFWDNATKGRHLHEVQNKAGGVRNNGTNTKELVIISIRVTGLITRLL